MSVVGLRYARAFGQVATAASLDPAAAQEQMKGFADLLAENGELREVLTDPSIATPQKNRVLDALAARLSISGPVRNFLAVVMDHGRLGELDEIRSEYALVADAGQHVVEAQIESAHALAEPERRVLAERTEQLAGGPVRLTWSENPALLGGAVIRIGSTVYDGSLRAQLEQMRQSLIDAGRVSTSS